MVSPKSTADEERRQTQLAQAEAESQARVDAIDTVRYVNAFPELTLWDRTGWSGRQSRGTVPYRAEVRLSGDSGHMVGTGHNAMVYIVWQDIRGWVHYNQLTDHIERGTLVGHWEEEGTGAVWRFDTDNNFIVRWGGRGTYELTGDNRITFVFDRHEGLSGLLGESYIPRRRFDMEAEMLVVDEDRRILRLSNRVVTVR